MAFAVNLAPEESDFAVIGEKAMREALSRGEVTIVDASAETQGLKGPIGKGNEVWRWMIGLLFALIGFEFLLATLPGGRRDGEDNRTMSQRHPRLEPRLLGGPHDGRPEITSQNKPGDRKRDALASLRWYLAVPLLGEPCPVLFLQLLPQLRR